MGSSALVSIVMTYYERFNQLKITLNSFQIHNYTNFEVIIIDDGSVLEPIDSNSFSGYHFPIHIINMPFDKTSTNPCVSFNAGFEIAKGDIIVIQNAECLHLDNLIDDARTRLTHKNYLTYTCYSLEKNISLLLKGDKEDSKLIKDVIKEYPIVTSNGWNAWKNHIEYRPNALHFTSAITKENLTLLGGFDKRYSKGTAFDDEEFLTRIKRAKLNVEIVNDRLSIHQWHTNPQTSSRIKRYIQQARNMLLYNIVTKNEKNINTEKSSAIYIFFRIVSPLLVACSVIIMFLTAIFKKFNLISKTII